MSIKFLVLGGGGYFGFWGGGGSADFIFMGARIFLRNPGLGNPGFSYIATQDPARKPPKLAPADLSIVLCTPMDSHTRRGDLGEGFEEGGGDL